MVRKDFFGLLSFFLVLVSLLSSDFVNGPSSEDGVKDFYRAQMEEEIEQFLSVITVDAKPDEAASVLAQSGRALVRVNDGKEAKKMGVLFDGLRFRPELKVFEKVPSDKRKGIYIWRKEGALWVTVVRNRKVKVTMFARNEDRPSKMALNHGKAMVLAGIMWLRYEGNVEKLEKILRKYESNFKVKEDWERILKLKELKRKRRRISPEE